MEKAEHFFLSKSPVLEVLCFCTIEIIYTFASDVILISYLLSM